MANESNQETDTFIYWLFTGNNAVPEFSREDATWLEMVFGYHERTTEQKARLHNLRRAAGLHAAVLLTECPGGPEREIALQRVQEAAMWANAAVSRLSRNTP